jgi:hypothetical protein
MSLPMRHLMLLALVACSSAHGFTEESLDGLDRWLDRWERARACLVSGGSDTAEGVAIAMLTGPECARFLHALDESIAVDHRNPQRMVWRDAVLDVRALEREKSAAEIVGLVERIDQRASTLASAIGRPRPVSVRGEPLPLATIKKLSSRWRITPAEDPEVACETRDHRWVLDAGGVRHRRDNGVTTHPLPDSSPVARIACRDHEALVVRGEPEMLFRCDPECSPLVLGPRRITEHGVAGFDSRGRWIYVATADAVVAMWRQGRARPVLFRLPFAATPVQVSGGEVGMKLRIEGPDGAYEASIIP